MQVSEYSNLERIEREHWYYAGKREIVEHWIHACRELRADDILLDFGAGTGLFASNFIARCKVRVLDSYPESLAILRKRLPAESVLEPAGPGIPVPDASIDCVTALDVLEHLADDAAAVREFERVLRPAGLAVITVPADMKLWSDWDASLLHFRRYERSGLLALFDTQEWEVLHCAYTNVLAYPAVFLLRKWAKGRGRKGSRVEDRVPTPWLNRLLRFLFTAPAKRRWFPAPFGVSLLVLARKR